MTRQVFVLSACLICASPAFAQQGSTTSGTTTAAGPTVTPPDKPATADKPAGKSADKPMTALETRIVADERDYKIGPEDVLDISVWKAPELSRTVPVRPDGKVSLPLINDIQAAGLTPSVLRQELARRLAEYVPSPEVAVIVREVHSGKVSVIGSVRNPGRYELKSPATVLELIALAQGFTDFANRDRIVIIRQNATGNPQRISFNYRKVADGSDQDNFFVQPGDIIVVP
jgi:polysaccharide export outer membrane protein